MLFLNHISGHPVQLYIAYAVLPRPGDQTLLFYVKPYYAITLQAKITSGVIIHILDITAYTKPVYLRSFDQQAMSFDLHSLNYLLNWWGSQQFRLQIGDNLTFTEPVVIQNGKVHQMLPFWV